MAQLPRPDEDVWGQLHRKLGDRLSLVTVDNPQQLAHSNRIYNRPVMGADGGRQRAPQVAGRVGRKAGSCHRIAEHGARQLKRAAGAFQFPFPFNIADRRQHVGGFNIGYGQLTD